jgi:hypothetical protein
VKAGHGLIREWPAVDGAVRGRSGSVGDCLFIQLDGLATFFFAPDSTEVEVVPEPKADRAGIEDSYRRIVLPLVLQAQGLEILHASAVESAKGLLFLCGDSGAGKSTVAFGLSRRGYALWADDAVAFRASPRPPVALPLPFTMRLLPDATAHYLCSRTPEDRKLEVRPAAPDRRENSLPLAVGLLLDERRSAPSEIQLNRVAPEVVLPVLLSHAFCFDPQDETRKRRMVEEYLALAATVPFFRITLAEGLEELDSGLGVIDELAPTR